MFLIKKRIIVLSVDACLSPQKIKARNTSSENDSHSPTKSANITIAEICYANARSGHTLSDDTKKQAPTNALDIQGDSADAIFELDGARAATSYSEKEDDEETIEIEVPEELIQQCNKQKKTSTFFPAIFSEDTTSYSLLLQCFESIYKAPKAIRGVYSENKQEIIGKFKYKNANGEDRKIYVMLIISNPKEDCPLRTLVTAYPIVGFKSIPNFTKVMTMDEGVRIENVEFMSEQNQARIERIKQAIIDDIKKQLEENPSLDLKSIEALNNKTLISQMFELDQPQMNTIIRDLTEDSGVLPTITCEILKAKFEDWDEEKLKRIIRFIRDRIDSAPSLVYYFKDQEKETKSKTLLSVCCTCTMLTTDQLSDKFGEGYEFTRTIADTGFFLHIDKSDIGIA